MIALSRGMWIRDDLRSPVLCVLLGRHRLELLGVVIFADAAQEFDNLLALTFGFAEGEELA